MTRKALRFALPSNLWRMAAARNAGLVDPRLAKALAHPLRARALVVLNERVASPNEIAEMLGEPLPNVSYHVRTLLDLDCIELVRTAQRRGAIEHYYRALKRPFFSDREWKRLPPSARQALVDATLQLVWDDVSESIEASTLAARPDMHVSRSALVLDERGWGEVTDALAALLEEAEHIARRSTERLERSAEPGVPSRLVLMHFAAPS
jgi:DNA-binding transcriptional ArsR family regulator